MTSTYVTTVPQMTFSLAPASPLLPRVDVLDLVIRLLVWLLALALRARQNRSATPKTRTRTRRAYSDRQFFTDIDRSLKAGYNLEWVGVTR
jgi:hypothetical protein